MYINNDDGPLGTIWQIIRTEFIFACSRLKRRQASAISFDKIVTSTMANNVGRVADNINKNNALLVRMRALGDLKL